MLLRNKLLRHKLGHNTIALALAVALLFSIVAQSYPFSANAKEERSDVGSVPKETGFSGISDFDYIDGSSANCGKLLDLGVPFTEKEYRIPDRNWVWVDKNQTFRSVTGIVTDSRVTHTDFPVVHDSHDWNGNILVDRGQESILSSSDKEHDDPSDPRPVDTLHVEWETGIKPSETRAESHPYFPSWAWPSVGDRVWIDGNWIWDCGHAEPENGKFSYYTEIHPARAIASMRDQVHMLPVEGSEFMPPLLRPLKAAVVTATDLYIHGHGGFIVDILNCGQDLIVSLRPNSCSTKTTPIDADFEFDICLPPKPFSKAELILLVREGPQNTIDIEPILETIPTAPNCDFFTSPVSVHVKIPLAGSGVKPTDTYARKIYAGWVYPEDQPLRHFKLRLVKMDLHDDMDLELSPDIISGLRYNPECECTFFWINLDRVPNEWERLVHFEIPTCDARILGECVHTNSLGAYDDDKGQGNGNLKFEGPTFDFFVRDGLPFTVRAIGYDQDCMDNLYPQDNLAVFVAKYFPWCFEQYDERTGDWPGENDPYNDFVAEFTAPDYRLENTPKGTTKEIRLPNKGGQYHLIFELTEIPLPEITLNPTSGATGVSISISGSNFAAGATGIVWFDIDGDSVLDPITPATLVAETSQDITSSSEGTFTATIAVPKLSAGTYSIRADIPKGGVVESSESFTVTVIVEDKTGLGPITTPREQTEPIKTRKTIKTFDIQVIGEGIESLDFNPKERLIMLRNDGSEGPVEIQIPKDFVSGKFNIKADEQEIDYDLSEAEKHSVLLFDRPSGSSLITIEGAEGPEAPAGTKVVEVLPKTPLIEKTPVPIETKVEKPIDPGKIGRIPGKIITSEAGTTIFQIDVLFEPVEAEFPFAILGITGAIGVGLFFGVYALLKRESRIPQMR